MHAAAGVSAPSHFPLLLLGFQGPTALDSKYLTFPSRHLPGFQVSTALDSESPTFPMSPTSPSLHHLRFQVPTSSVSSPPHTPPRKIVLRGSGAPALPWES